MLQFSLEKITCAKREKKITCREEKSQPPWISNGPSLICVDIAFHLVGFKQSTMMFVLFILTEIT